MGLLALHFASLLSHKRTRLQRVLVVSDPITHYPTMVRPTLNVSKLTLDLSSCRVKLPASCKLVAARPFGHHRKRFVSTSLTFHRLRPRHPITTKEPKAVASSFTTTRIRYW